MKFCVPLGHQSLINFEQRSSYEKLRTSLWPPWPFVPLRLHSGLCSGLWRRPNPNLSRLRLPLVLDPRQAEEWIELSPGPARWKHGAAWSAAADGMYVFGGLDDSSDGLGRFRNYAFLKPCGDLGSHAQELFGMTSTSMTARLRWW